MWQFPSLLHSSDLPTRHHDLCGQQNHKESLLDVSHYRNWVGRSWGIVDYPDLSSLFVSKNNHMCSKKCTLPGTPGLTFLITPFVSLVILCQNSGSCFSQRGRPCNRFRLRSWLVGSRLWQCRTDHPSSWCSLTGLTALILSDTRSKKACSLLSRA